MSFDRRRRRGEGVQSPTNRGFIGSLVLAGPGQFEIFKKLDFFFF